MPLHRIFPSFATKAHTTFKSGQLIIGKSTPEFTNRSIGSDWHCAIGNNWFVQVSGRKYWQFIEPIYSHYLHPLKGGFFNMWTGNPAMNQLEKHLPRRTVTLEPGDLLYNPDWMWHKIISKFIRFSLTLFLSCFLFADHCIDYGGITIGVPLREGNGTIASQNNFYFSSIVLTNKFLSGLGLPLGGYPAPTASTEQDNL